MGRWIVAAMLSATVAAAALPAAAQSDGVVDPILTQDGVRYACTGVGAASREDPRWSSFATKLVFAAKDGGYLSQVATRIAAADGAAVFAVRDCGPWLLLDLPKGSYAVTVTAHDGAGRSYNATTTLVVGDGGRRETIVRFPGIAG